jgi:hypothetical protein
MFLISFKPWSFFTSSVLQLKPNEQTQSGHTAYELLPFLNRKELCLS